MVTFNHSGAIYAIVPENFIFDEVNFRGRKCHITDYFSNYFIDSLCFFFIRRDSSYDRK